MIEIQPIWDLHVADLQRVAGRYVSDGRYAVSYVDTDDKTELSLTYEPLPTPFEGNYDHFDDETMAPIMIAFSIAIISLTLIPGATTMLVIRRAMMGGASSAFMTILGGSLGVMVHAFVAAVGLSIIFQQNEAVRWIVRAAGAGYLIYLGLKSIVAAWRGTSRIDAEKERAEKAAKSGWLAAAEGLLTILLSPETALFYLSAFSQFTTPAAPLLPQAIAMGAVHVAVRIVWYGLVAFFASRMYQLLIKPVVQRGFEAAAGAILIGFAVRMLARS